MQIIVTVFWRTDHLDIRTEIYLLPVRDWYIHALFRNIKHHEGAFHGVNRTAWGTKLLLMAVWASLVDCISSCHLLKA